MFRPRTLELMKKSKEQEIADTKQFDDKDEEEELFAPDSDSEYAPSSSKDKKQFDDKDEEEELFAPDSDNEYAPSNSKDKKQFDDSDEEEELLAPDSDSEYAPSSSTSSSDTDEDIVTDTPTKKQGKKHLSITSLTRTRKNLQLEQSAIATSNADDPNIIQENNQPPKRKKSDPTKWKRQIQRMKRLKGEEYSTGKGKKIPARPLKPPRCLKNPNHSCNSYVPLEKRQKIQKEFRDLKDLHKQREFILNHVTLSSKSRQTIVGPSRRQNTCKYTFSCDGEKKIVCKNFFLDTLNVTEGLVRGAFKKLSTCGVLQSDQRGRKPPPQKINNNDEEFIRSHILSFPQMESHYCRRSSEYKYLDSSLNISTMYNLYKQKAIESGRKAYGLETYRKIFREYKLNFHKPKKDLCKTCVVNEGKVDETSDRESYLQHLKRKEAARNWRDEDKETIRKDPKVIAFNFDLQAVLNTPKGAAGPFYYVRKLAVYNLTIYNLGNQEVECYIWDETEGKRGSIEISTIIYKFLMAKTDSEHVRMMSDSCSGQQKNTTFACMCLNVVKNHQTIQLIDHRFFEPGHSQMECDSIHSKIEQKSKHVPVFTPLGWEQLIRAARSKPQPFNVTTLLHDDFINFNNNKNIFQSENLPHRNLPFRSAVWMQYRKEEPKRIFVKTGYDEVDFKIFSLKQKRGRSLDFHPIQAYQKRLPISAAKQKDLMKLCNDQVIPKVHHYYYNNLPVAASVQDNLPEPTASDESDYE